MLEVVQRAFERVVERAERLHLFRQCRVRPRTGAVDLEHLRDETFDLRECQRREAIPPGLSVQIAQLAEDLAPRAEAKED